MPPRGLALIAAGLLLAPASIAAPVIAQDATPSAECAATTLDENKDLVRAFYTAVESASAEDFATVLDDDHVFHGPVGVEPGEEAGGAELLPQSVHGARRRDGRYPIEHAGVPAAD